MNKDEKPEWTIDDFDIKDCLGNGKYGYVYKAIEKNSKAIVAIKLINKNIINQYKFHDQVRNEVEIHSRLQHKNIVRLYAYFYDDVYIYLVYEFMKKGSLFSLLKNEGVLNEENAKKVVKQIVEALTYLRQRKLIHRDLKLENILLNDLDDIKLSDFGWVCQHFDEHRDTLCGTPEYIPPEMIIDKQYDYKVDIWSLGIISYELLTGKTPFSGETPNELIENIKTKAINIQEDEILQSLSLSKNCIDFVDKCLQKDKSLRWNIDKLSQHNWFLE